MAQRNPLVDQWFAEVDHPRKEAMQSARWVFLEADARISESIKWSAPTFEYKGNRASFQPNAKKFVSVMFHRGAEIPGDHPGLEGDAALVRVMRFEDEVDVEAQRGSLEAIVRAWCDWKDG